MSNKGLNNPKRNCEKCELWKIELGVCDINFDHDNLIIMIPNGKKGFSKNFEFFRTSSVIWQLWRSPTFWKSEPEYAMEYAAIAIPSTMCARAILKLKISFGWWLLAISLHTLNILVSRRWVYLLHKLHRHTRLQYLNTIYILCAFRQRTEITILLAICKE